MNTGEKNPGYREKHELAGYWQCESGKHRDKITWGSQWHEELKLQREKGIETDLIIPTKGCPGCYKDSEKQATE